MKISEETKLSFAAELIEKKPQLFDRFIKKVEAEARAEAAEAPEVEEVSAGDILKQIKAAQDTLKAIEAAQKTSTLKIVKSEKESDDKIAKAEGKSADGIKKAEDKSAEGIKKAEDKAAEKIKAKK